MGMVVQLTSLAVLSRLVAGHYLYASAIAVELAVRHNVVWHVHFTWRDRRDPPVMVSQVIRFHLSNGLVSLLGNLALMRIMVHEKRLPLLISNCVAILCCSMINFCLGDSWAFAVRAREGRDGVG
jgi:putative flippase GtrA